MQTGCFLDIVEAFRINSKNVINTRTHSVFDSKSCKSPKSLCFHNFIITRCMFGKHSEWASGRRSPFAEVHVVWWGWIFDFLSRSTSLEWTSGEVKNPDFSGMDFCTSLEVRKSLKYNYLINPYFITNAPFNPRPISVSNAFDF